jgi:hypothetical protein
MFFAIFTMAIISATAQSLQRSEQENKVHNKLFYIELGGPGVILSMNYDMRFKPNSRLGLGFRAGAGFGIGEFDEETHSYYSIPVQINYIFGKETSSSSFEIGGGASFLTRKVSLYNYDTDIRGHFIGHLSFMYRLQPIRGGVVLRVGFTPIIGTSGDLYPMGAISLGYTF